MIGRAIHQYRLRSPLSRRERKLVEIKKEEERAASQGELFPKLKPQDPKEVFGE